MKCAIDSAADIRLFYEIFFIYFCISELFWIFHLYGDVIITGEGLQNLGAQGLWAGRDLYQANLRWHRASVFPVSSQGPPPFNCLLRLARGCGGPILTKILSGPHSIASYDTQGNVEDLKTFKMQER
jgi:hypothetical protein